MTCECGARHWRIDEASGRMSGGVCVNCGRRKENAFQNAFDGNEFLYDRMLTAALKAADMRRGKARVRRTA